MGVHNRTYNDLVLQLCAEQRKMSFGAIILVTWRCVRQSSLGSDTTHTEDSSFLLTLFTGQVPMPTIRSTSTPSSPERMNPRCGTSRQWNPSGSESCNMANIAQSHVVQPHSGSRLLKQGVCPRNGVVMRSGHAQATRHGHPSVQHRACTWDRGLKDRHGDFGHGRLQMVSLR